MLVLQKIALEDAEIEIKNLSIEESIDLIIKKLKF